MISRLHFALTALLLACPVWSISQTPTLTNACGSTGTVRVVGDLTSNAKAQTAARRLANSIVTSYSDYATKNPASADRFVPEMGAFLDELNSDVLAEFATTVLPDLLKTQICQATKQAATNTGVAAAVTAQTNKQVGAPSTAAGTTSVTEKTAVTQLLGIAVQNGAINNNVTGNTMTLSTSAYGFVTGLGWIKDTANDYATWSPFTRLGASATFNLTNASGSSTASNSTNATDPLASATHRQISQWQAKFTFKDTTIRSRAVMDIFNGKDPGKKTTASSLQAKIANSLNSPSRVTSLSAAGQIVVNEMSRPDFAAMLQPLDQIFEPASDSGQPSQATLDLWNAISAGATAKPDCSGTAASDPCASLEQSILKWLTTYPAYVSLLTKTVNDATAQKLIAQFAADEASYLAADKQFEADVKNLQSGWNAALTFGEQYPTTSATTTAATSTTTATRKPSAPAYLISGLNVSWQKPAPDAGATSTHAQFQSWIVNFAGSVYPNPLVALNEQTFRGGTVSTNFEWNLGKSKFLASTVDKSQVTLAFSGQYQRLQENKDLKGKKADLALGNAKLEIPISSGVSFPLSITFANSSEQVKESYVRGNFGISFDLDKLAALLKAK